MSANTGNQYNKDKFGVAGNSWQPFQNGLATQFWVAPKGLSKNCCARIHLTKTLVKPVFTNDSS